MKVCSCCKKELSLDKFKWRNDTQNYRRTCISCDKLKARERYLKNSNPSYRKGDILYPDKFCLNCGELLKKQGGSTYKDLKFCSQECHFSFKRGKHNKICGICGKEYNHRTNKYCSKECRSKDHAVNNTTKVKCDYCRKDIVIQNNKLFLDHHFCNRNCFTKYQGINPLNTVNKIVKICKICSREFEVYPSHEKQSKDKGWNIKYCSIDCRNKDTEEMTEKAIEMNKLQSHKSGLNKIEKVIKQILDDIGLRENTDYYSQYKMFDKFLVDFFIVSSNLVIQCDGDYWHGHISKLKNGIPDKRQDRRMKYDRSQDAYLEKRGVIVIRFWEHSILNNKEDVYDNIRKTIFKIA